MLLKLRTIVYYAPDLEATKAWFSDFLGTQPYFDQPFYVGFDIQGHELGLDPDPTPYSMGSQSHHYWLVSELDSVLDHAQTLGAEVVSPKTSVGGETYIAQFRTPTGQIVGLIEEGV